jgi:hypothetical protein
VQELSSATGVPTPFIVAYEQQFSDCDAAEAHVHAALERKGLRISKEATGTFRIMPKLLRYIKMPHVSDALKRTWRWDILPSMGWEFGRIEMQRWSCTKSPQQRVTTARGSISWAGTARAASA